MIKRITTRGTATVGELIEALQELNPSDEAYLFAYAEEHGTFQAAIESIESEKNLVFIGPASDIGEE